MTCLLTLTITALGATFTVDREYEGNLKNITQNKYRVDFSVSKLPELGILEVPKSKCEKAE